MMSLTHKVGSPHVVSAAFMNRGTRVSVELDDGQTIAAPLASYHRLQHGSPRDRKDWLMGVETGIHWPDLDEDISVEALRLGRRSLESQSSIRRRLDEHAARTKRRKLRNTHAQIEPSHNI